MSTSASRLRPTTCVRSGICDDGDRHAVAQVLHQVVGHHARGVDVVLRRRRADSDRRPWMSHTSRESASVPSRALLLGGQRAVQELVDDLHVGALRHEERHGVRVVRRRARIRQRPGVLVDAEQHERGLERRQGDPALADLVHQDRRRRARRLAAVLASGDVAGHRRVVVVDDDLDARVQRHGPELSDRARDRACRP